jgi:transposase
MLTLECDVNVPDTIPDGHPVGIDLGLDKFVATSDGDVIDRPRFLSALHIYMRVPRNNFLRIPFALARGVRQLLRTRP